MGSGAANFDLPFARVLGREPPCCRKVDGAHHEWAHVQPRCVLKRDRRAVQAQSEPWRPKLRPERREPRARSTHAKPAPPLPVAYALRAETRPRLRAAGEKAEQPERGESGEGGESVGEPAPARRRQVVVLQEEEVLTARTHAQQIVRPYLVNIRRAQHCDLKRAGAARQTVWQQKVARVVVYKHLKPMLAGTRRER